MGRLLDGLKDAEYNPHTAVCKLPQPFRMLDKLLSRLVDDAVNLAVERDEARLAARASPRAPRSWHRARSSTTSAR